VRGVEPDQHFVGNLRITRLVRAHQAQPIAAQQGSKPIGKKKDRETKEYGCLPESGPARQPIAPVFGRLSIRGQWSRLHFEGFSISSYPRLITA